jgi:type II secretory pathway component GspD/PulD (secretin)
MKTVLLTPILWLGFAGLPAGLPAQNHLPSTAIIAAMPENNATPAASAPTAAQEPELRFNFRGAPLETVLNYMSDAAGYIIVLETPVRGTVDMWSSQTVSKDEAIQLLNLALNKNGYTARVQGRNLIVSSKDDARKQNIPIHTGSDPGEIPLTAEMVMQIIPLRHIDATQAAHDLGTLLPGSATLTANQDSNSLVVTDTEINVHHIVEIVAALDTSIDSVSAIRVFPLRNADPVEMAQLLTSLFTTTTPPAQTLAGRAGQFGGGRFAGTARGGGNAGATLPDGAAAGAAFRTGPAGGGRTNGTTAAGRTTPVVAVADPRTFSVVVTASKVQMPEIAEMLAQLDNSSARKQKVFVYTMENADVKQAETILKNLFQSNNTRGSTSTQADPLSTRASNNSQTTTITPSLSIGSTSGIRNQ